jgi:Tol biopolymer transport system component
LWSGTHVDKVLQRFDDGSTVLDPAFSNRADRLAYVRYTAVTKDASGKDDFGADLWVSASDGSEARMVVKHSILGESIESPVWLPGDERIAYTIITPKDDGSADDRIESVEVATGRRTRLVEHADQPALMPDGRSLIYRLSDFRPGRSGETPVLYDLESGRQIDLQQYNLPLLFIGAFATSPDGRTIAFGGADPSVRAPSPGVARRLTAASSALHPLLQDIWLMRLDGGGARRIADLAVDRPSLAWSRDGAWLYAMTNIGFWRIDPRTGAYKKIGPGGYNIRIRTVPSRP